MEAASPDFAPAVPFVTAFSGIIGAAETLKVLLGFSVGLHFQRHFHYNRTRILQMVCDPECQCQDVHG